MPAALVAAIAPSLISSLAKQGLELLSGFFNTAATPGVTKVAKLLQERTGIRVEDIAEDKLTDAQWAQLKEFELSNQELLLQELETSGTLEISRLQLANEDRKGARDLQRDAMQAKDWMTRNFIYVYAIGLTLLAFVFIMFACFSSDLYVMTENGLLDGPSQQRAGTIDTVMGFMLGVTLSAVIQFFFGSSVGSGQKSATIDRMLNRITDDAAPAGGN